MRPAFLAGVLLLGTLLAGPPAHAGAAKPEARSESEARHKADEVSRQIERSRAAAEDNEARQKALKKEIDGLRTQLIAASSAVQRREQDAAELAARLGEVEQRLDAARARLRSRRGEIVGTLAALERVALHPPEAALVGPQPPVDAIRGMLLLKAALPPLQQQATGLRGELAALAADRDALRKRRRELNAALAELGRDRDRMNQLLQRKTAVMKRTAAEGRAVASRIERLTHEAKSLQDLLAKLEAERRAREAAASEAARKEAEARAAAARRKAALAGGRAGSATGPATGHATTASLPQPSGSATFVRPAVGRVVQRFGEGSEVTNHGILIQVSPGATVVAPEDGRVVYSGPFRGYGVLLIIEHAGGYHSLLAGLSRADAVVGQWVLAGEPIGTIDASAGEPPRLYVEFRHKGQPVDPLPRLMAQKG